MGTRTFFVFLLISCSYLASAEDNKISIPKEAPLALLSLNIGDADVDFTISGSWSLSLYVASGIIFKPQTGPLILDSFPEMATGFYFNQVPDVSFTLWVIKRYFFELSYEGSFDQNKFKAGYEGKEGEFLRHVYIGNKDVGLAGYKFLDVPDSSYSSLGASVLFTGTSSEHEAIVRYESNSKGKKVFVGQNEADEYTVHPEGYALGRYFRLPDQNVDNYALYIQDPLGTLTSSTDNTKYRQATVDDAVIDPVQGTVWVKKDFVARILVYYTKNGLPVGSNPSIGLGAIVREVSGNIDISGARNFSFGMGPVFGEDMATRSIALNGQNCLLLWEPGGFSPFEISAAYLLPQNLPNETWRTTIVPVIKGSTIGKLGVGVSFRGIPLTNQFIAYLSNDLSDFRNLYPFFDPSFTIYGPGRKLSSSSTDFDILVTVLTPVSDYYLEEKLIPGSIHVTRNGVEETRFTVDFASGRLSFPFQINPEDRIEVTYGKNLSLFDSGDLLVAWGNRIKLNDALSLEISSGLRWNLLPGAFTTTAYSRTGSVNGVVSLKGKQDDFYFDVTAGVSVGNPDTTGIFRLLGMEYSDYPVGLSQETAYPASAPSDPVGLPSVVCSQNNRGRLFFKDYRLYGAVGDSALQPISWSLPAAQDFSYSTGSKPGPYEVADKSFPDSHSSLVEDFSISSSQKWVGMQIPLVQSKGVVDLSEADSISISYKTLNVTGADTYSIYLQIGDIGEDLDGNLRLDEEPSASSNGFHFNDTSNAADLLVGSGPKNTGNSRRDTEDIDSSGFLDPENSSRIVSVPQIDFLSGSSGWNLFSYSFNDAEKKMLVRARSLRVLIVDQGISGGDGKVLIDRITISGSSFWKGNVTSPDVCNIREINEAFAKNKPTQTLEQKYPTVSTTFHKSGAEQKVLEVDWSGAATGFTVTNRFLPSAGGIKYGDVVYYMRLPQISTPASSTIVSSLTDANGKAITWTYVPQIQTDWQEMKLDINAGILSAGSSPVSGASVTVDPGYNYTPVSFDVNVTGSTNVLLYLDEVQLTNPSLSLGAAFEGNLGLNLKGDLVRAGDVPILSDLVVAEKVLYTSPAYSPLYGTNPTGSNLFASITDLSVGILYSELDIHLDVNSLNDLLSVSPGHTIKIPKEVSVVNVTDTYRITQAQTGSQLFRENTLALMPIKDVLSFMGGTQAYSIGDTLVQSWPLSATLNLKDVANVAAHTDYSESKNGFSYTEDNYFKSWIMDFAYVLPFPNGTPLEQKGGAGLTGSVHTLPIGCTLDASMGFHDFNYVTTTRTSSNSIDYGLAFPVTIPVNSGKNIIFTTGYRRHFESSDSVSGAGSLEDDLGAWGNSIGNSPYIFNQTPFVECFDPAAETAFINANGIAASRTSMYKPEIFANFSKPASSQVVDLFIPSQGEISFGKVFDREAGLFDFRKLLKLSITNNAINLFGKVGSYPLFDFFVTDEYVLSFLMNLELSDRIVKGDYYIDGVFTFRGENKDAFSISNQCRIQNDIYYLLSERCTLALEWGVYPKEGVMLPIVSEATGATGFWSNREECAIIVTDSTQGESVHPLTIVATHTTGLSYPDKGYIRGVVSIGLDYESAETGSISELYTRLAFKLGIEGQFKW